MGTSDAVLDREEVLEDETVLDNETSVEKENIETEGAEKTVHHTLTKAQQKYLPLKRAIDVVLSGGAIVLLFPVLGAIAVAIKIDSPGPVLFKQKRVGKDCKFFEIWKFRSMRTDTPKDMPTHMLNDPGAFITKIGRFLRKTSLDELPQIFNIFRGQMSIIGPRPALWNQDDLVAERDKYGANDVTPGLTGWAQINGRDELEIPVKAKFDGEYVEKMSLWMDIKCFLGTIGSVLSHDGVVEGGTGEMHKEGEKTGDGSEVLVSPEKINKEIKTGAAVVGVAGAVGVGALVAIGKHFLGEKDNKVENKHTGLKVVGAVAVGAAAEVAIYNRKKAVNNRNIPIKEEAIIRDDNTKIKVTASIVTYNSADEIGNVLNSLLELRMDDLYITVVDNASSDGTADIVAEKYPQVKLIKSEKNVGFGAGHNMAITNIDSDYHIFVNPDITVEDGQIQKMVEYMDAHKNVVILTPKILNSDGTEQYLPKRYPKLRYFVGGRFEDKSKLCYHWRSKYTLRGETVTTPRKIDFCTGCFMMCRTSVLKQCGGFDERYFLHFEDADLTREMQKYGDTVYVPDVHVTHGWKRENAGSGKVFKIALQSMFKYFWKWK